MNNNLTKKRIADFASRNRNHLFFFLLSIVYVNICMPQQQTDSTKKVHPYKNVIRYNLSGALIFGMDRFIVFGYERMIRKNQSMSINFGKAELPKIVTINTDSFSVSNDVKSTGTNVSIDYRFYLPKENKYLAPHGLYIGPYYSFNGFERDNQWNRKNSSGGRFVNTHTEFNIHTIGFELGYQFILWKRLALDFLMVGPGLGIYKYKATFDSNISAADKEQLLDGLEQLLKQKFPGMNFVFADKEISSEGTLNTTSLGYRYLIHIGFNF